MYLRKTIGTLCSNSIRSTQCTSQSMLLTHSRVSIISSVRQAGQGHGVSYFPHSPGALGPIYRSLRYANFRDRFNSRINKKSIHPNKKGYEKMLEENKRLQKSMEDALVSQQITRVKQLLPDGRTAQPFDPSSVTVPEPPKKKPFEFLTSRFGQSLQLGNLNAIQISMLLMLVGLFVWAKTQTLNRTHNLPEKKHATPVIDYVRTLTLLRHVWTVRILLEIGALRPIDGLENTLDEDRVDRFEEEFADYAENTVEDKRKDTNMAAVLGTHPQVLRTRNYVNALAMIDKELGDLEKEFRQALIEVMELFDTLGTPYKGQAGACLEALQSHSLLPLIFDKKSLLMHEEFNDALQVLFTRQNSTHRSYGQMFSDMYAMAWLSTGTFALPANERATMPRELAYYINTIGYDIVRVYQDHYMHDFHKRLSKFISRLAFPSEIVEYALEDDTRADNLEPYVRELRRIDPNILTDYNDFIEFYQTTLLTSAHKSWWRRMIRRFPRFRRSDKAPSPLVISTYTRLFREYESIFGKIPYITMLTNEVYFLEKLKDLSLGHTVDIHSVIYSMCNSRQEITRKSEYRTNELQTIKMLPIPRALKTRYVYDLIDKDSPMVALAKEHLRELNENLVIHPLFPDVASYREIYQDITDASRLLASRDMEVVEMKKQLGQIYRTLDSKDVTPELRARIEAREKELLSVPDVREYASGMTKEEIKHDDEFLYNPDGIFYDEDDEEAKNNRNRHRGRVQDLIIIPDPPKHIIRAITELDHYVDVRPLRPGLGQDRQSILSHKFRLLRGYVPIPDKIDKPKDRKPTKEERQALNINRVQRLHALAAANLAKLETCVVQDLLEVNAKGIDIKMPLDGLLPKDYDKYIVPPLVTLSRDIVPESVSGAHKMAPGSTAYMDTLMVSGAHTLLNEVISDTVHQDFKEQLEEVAAQATTKEDSAWWNRVFSMGLFWPSQKKAYTGQAPPTNAKRYEM